MRKIFAAFIIFVLVFSNTVLAGQEPQTVYFYVSTGGNDKNAGSKEQPLLTLNGAKNAVRNSGLLGKKKIEVVFEGGCYRFDQTVSFEAEDSGTKEFPVKYRSESGNEVTFDGGYQMKRSALKPIQDEKIKKRLSEAVRDKVLCGDLTQIGIKSIPEINPNDHGIAAYINSPTAVYYNDEKMTLARYPNEGGWLKTGKLISSGSKDENTQKSARVGGAFQYTDDRIEKWENIETVWMYGRWNVDWAPGTTPIGKLDKENKTIYAKLSSCYGYLAERNYYYFNVLEELDIPGEFYIDRENLKLYIYPADDNENGSIYITDLANEFINLKYCQYVTFSGITFQGNRANGIVASNCRGISFLYDTIRYIGLKGFVFSKGFEYVVDHCRIYELGAGGIIVDSGDKSVLKASDTRITNNNIYNFSTWKPTYTAAVETEGTGELIANNEIHGGNHCAILPLGTETIVEYNDIYDVLRTADDSGVIYTYMNALNCGVVIRYNFIHSTAKRGVIVNTGNWAVYWDGFTSNNYVYGNVIYDMPGGLHLNGGQGHFVEDNVFINVETPINAHAFVSHGANDFWKRADEVPYDRGVWKQRYPQLSEKRDNNAYTMYRDNTIGDNIIYNCVKNNLGGVATKGLTNNFFDNVVIQDKSFFKNFDKFDFSIAGENPIKDFPKIDMSKIGIDGNAGER